MTRIFLLLVSILFLNSCKKKFESTPYSSEEIGRYIAARVPAVIDAHDPVRIRFAVPPDTTQKVALFEFNPATKGSYQWIDGMTLSFTPDDGWKPGAEYQVQVNIGKVIPDADLKKVVFEFSVRPVKLMVSFEPLIPQFEGDEASYLLRGRINTSTSIDSNQVAEVFSIKTAGEVSKAEWFHSPDGRTHEFIIPSIGPNARLEFQWNGEPIGSKDKSSRTILVPKADELSVLSIETGSDQERKIEIHFSQKLSPQQDLNGLVTINGKTDGFRMVKQDHVLTLYPEETVIAETRMRTRTEMLQEKISIQLHPGITSNRGFKLQESVTFDVSLSDSKPGLRLVGSGTITPGHKEIIFPFEAINLRSVQVEVLRIFENNILQYLQQSSLEDQWAMEPVGRIILQKQIDLSQISDRDNRNIWTRYALDLGPLVELAPGSIYQVRIGFSGTDTYFDCYKEPEVEKREVAFGEVESMWQYNYRYEDFRWEQTEDPCYPAFYNPERFISRNVLASDIGLTAKQNDQGQLWGYAASIETAKPKSSIEVEIYDFQQQMMTQTVTNSEGEISVSLPRKAFFIVAIEGDQRGYLRMPDGGSLPMSEFNVGGTGYQQGLRGFIYAERDVWRPGDTVHLNFILWDPEGKIDDRHPVRLTVTNPLGQKKIEKTAPLSVGGIYDLAFHTGAVDPTGTWMAKVTVGDAEFSKALRIETIKPNRLKIDARLPDEIVIDGKDQQLTVEASWLFGAPASNLKAVVEAQFSPLPFVPDQFKGYTFSDPARITPSTVTTIFDGVLDAQGRSTMKIPDIRESLPEGRLTMSVRTRVFESGGDFSTDRHSAIYHPYTHYAGVSIPANRWGYEELKMNETNVIRLASVNTAGKGVAGRRLSVGIYNAQWRWWWDRTAHDITQYNSELHVGAISTDTVTTGSNGIANYEVIPAVYGSYMVRVCDMESGHCSGKFYYAGYWGDPSSTTAAANKLTFSTDKEKYHVGEKIRINVPSSTGSRLLLTLEKNNKVISSRWYDVKADQTQIQIDATAEMMPNVYAFISHIQPFEHTHNDMPLRMYGVLPIMVADPKTMLHPKIEMPDVLQPSKNFTVSVSEQDKLPMAYTIAVVDEGLLGLTRFKSPDPWEFFHRQEALAVQTWDMYDQVLGGYGGTIDRLLSLGGDGVAALVDVPQAERFKPVVRHLGPFYLKEGEKRSHTITMPNYVGAVRVMVVASDRKRWGVAEKTATVKSDLMIHPTLPRVVSPGETVTLPVNVYAMSDQVKAVDVTVTTNEMATLVGGNSQSITFKDQGDKLVRFNLKIPERPGLLKVKVEAKSGTYSSSQDVEIDVRIPNPPVTEVVATTLAAGQKWTGKIPFPGMAGTNEASIELSQMPPINLQERLLFLIQYPYGCLEQTLSSVFPQLYLAQLTDLSPARQQQVRINIQAGIQRLRSFSLPSGGFTYWPGERSRDSWSHSYAGHFLIEAIHAGYTVDKSMMDGWRTTQKKDAQAYQPRQYYREDLIQAYRLYTLALDGQPLWGMMNRLRAERDRDPVATWLLAASYALGKRNDVAQSLIDQLSTDVKPYQELAFTYGSDMRDEAIILETFLQMGKRNDAMQVARNIANLLSGNDWYSTQSLSWALVAMGKLASEFSGDPIKVIITQGEKRESVSTTKALIVRPLQTQSSNLSVENQSGDPLYIRVTSTGRPLQGVTSEVRSNLSLKAKYMDVQGRDINPEKLPQGQDFIVQLTVTNPGTFTTSLEQMALAYMFPSGWELTNPRMDQFAGRFSNSSFNYQDIRDDRVNTFFNVDRGSVTYNFLMTATYAGKYWLPDIMSEAMYSHQVRARLPGRWVEVVPAVTRDVVQ